MSDAQIPVPLRDRNGAVIAYAVLDVDDAALADHRWYLDSDPARERGKLYARRTATVDGRRVGIYLHREVLGLTAADPLLGDHVNGLTLDNRRANLRAVTAAENAQNVHRQRCSASSRHRGVTWDASRGKWMARAGGRTLGRFDDEQDAADAAAAWRAEHMPLSAEAAA